MKHIFKVMVFFFIAMAIISCTDKKSENENPSVKTKDSAKFEKVDTYINKMISNRTTNGIGVLVAKDGEIIYHKAFGNMKLDTPMKKDTIFLMYSSSKIVPAIAIMKLVDEGKVSLDDPLDKYLPEFSSQKIRLTSPKEKLVPVKKQLRYDKF